MPVGCLQKLYITSFPSYTLLPSYVLIYFINEFTLLMSHEFYSWHCDTPDSSTKMQKFIELGWGQTHKKTAVMHTDRTRLILAVGRAWVRPRGHFKPPRIILWGQARLISWSGQWEWSGTVKGFCGVSNNISFLLTLSLLLLVFIFLSHYSFQQIALITASYLCLLCLQFFSPCCGRGRGGAGGNEWAVFGVERFSGNSKLENTIPKPQLWNRASAEVIEDWLLTWAINTGLGKFNTEILQTRSVHFLLPLLAQDLPISNFYLFFLKISGVLYIYITSQFNVSWQVY